MPSNLETSSSLSLQPKMMLHPVSFEMYLIAADIGDGSEEIMTLTAGLSFGRASSI